jgi:uncharacterized membrane protein
MIFPLWFRAIVPPAFRSLSLDLFQVGLVIGNGIPMLWDAAAHKNFMTFIVSLVSTCCCYATIYSAAMADKADNFVAMIFMDLRWAS